MRVKENMLILPALYIIKRHGTATTSDLIDELTIVFNPSGEDAEILAGRNDTKFSQIVRNLKSHRDSNGMGIYTDFADGIYSLTQAGEDFLNTRIDELNYLFSQKFQYDDTLHVSAGIADKKKKIFVYDENSLVSEGKVEIKASKSRERSKALRDAAIQHYSVAGKLYCSVCNFCFEEKYGELGKDFIEIHHEKPVCSFDEEGSAQFISEAVKNVKPLCANCHRMIHRNHKKPMTIEELKKIIEPSSN